MMFVSKSLVALLALSIASTVSAHPSDAVTIHRRHHRARALHARTCHPRSVSSSVVTSAAAAATDIDVGTTSSASSFSSSVHASSSHSTADTKTSSVHSSSARASSTHSSAAAAATGSSLHTELAALAPISNIVESWSTAPSASDALPLSDATFRIHNLLTALPHPYVNAPDGQLSMKATYPKGSYNFQHQPLGGLSFYAQGPASVDLTTAKEVTFGYSVFFEEGFQFNKGGKLPGLCKHAFMAFCFY